VQIKVSATNKQEDVIKKRLPEIRNYSIYHFVGSLRKSP